MSYASHSNPLSSGPYQGGGYYSQKEYRFVVFFFTFDRSGPAIVFYFLTITEHVSYSSRKLPINTRYIRNSKDGEYYSRKDCGWFLIGLSIFDFLSNLSGPDMQ